MKYQMNALIVVEGVTDVQRLTPLIDAEFITTNGSALSQETIDYIKQVQKAGRDIIVFTDPDFPGEKIRKTLDANIPGLSHAFIDKKLAIKHGKVGIAQADKETILQALQSKFTTKIQGKGDILPGDLLTLGLVGNDTAQARRLKVCQHFHLGPCNVKTMVKRLNVLGIQLSDIQNIL